MPAKSSTRPSRIRASPLTPIAAHPSTTHHYPWRFTLGEWVHVVGFPQNRTYRVEGGRIHRGFPLYILRSSSGEEQRIFQIHLSSTIIPHCT